jgi:hypothetical protein
MIYLEIYVSSLQKIKIIVTDLVDGYIKLYTVISFHWLICIFLIQCFAETYEENVT